MYKQKSDYLSWDEYFMAVAVLSGLRSKDPNTKVGACIVSPGRKIVGTGYNGFPRNCVDFNGTFSWDRDGEFLDTKYPYVVHAELNAILNSHINILERCTLYSTLFPCNECAKAIIQAGIKYVVYLENKYKDSDSYVASNRLFKATGIEVRQVKLDRVIISLNNES